MPKHNYTEYDYPHLQDNFYNHLFQTWANLHLSLPKNAEEISEQPLWHNTYIKIGGKIIEYPSWQNQNINYIQDIINNKGEILGKKTLNAKFGNICKYLEYESLVSAIKSD